MDDGVKGRAREYDASGRRRRADERRRAVIAAARELLEERGWTATTIADVARTAGVSAESVYQRFGSKAALVQEVFDVAIAGDDAPVAVADRPENQRIRAEPDLRTKLRLYAEGAALRAERSARVQLAIRAGAGSDANVADLWRTISEQRLVGVTMFARHLVASGGVREGVDEAEIADVVWTCLSVEVYDLLVLQRGWSTTAYADWLTRTLVAAVAEA
ncbi:TetR/AcrR family transcriptional regulator [uncultured Nocardioides sp.]|uniref:TetR/AcrR family transcriptional regulator n=1 Tax=uncultured Nocardioides sp. TaxID=198441 RepID=UPI0026037319|nr:TetR/AcrR family transcriptional regulator [uncultured Nocardioides sp.]